MTISKLVQPCRATKHDFQCSIWTQRKYTNSKFAIHIRNSHSLSAATQLPSSVEGPWSSRKSLVAVQLSLQGWKIALKVGIDRQKHTLRHTLNTITKSKQLHTAHLILFEWVVFRDVNAKMRPQNVFCHLCRPQSEMPGTFCNMPDISFHVWYLQILQGFSGGTKSAGSPGPPPFVAHEHDDLRAPFSHLWLEFHNTKCTPHVEFQKVLIRKLEKGVWIMQRTRSLVNTTSTFSTSGTLAALDKSLESERPNFESRIDPNSKFFMVCWVGQPTHAEFHLWFVWRLRSEIRPCLGPPAMLGSAWSRSSCSDRCGQRCETHNMPTCESEMNWICMYMTVYVYNLI